MHLPPEVERLVPELLARVAESGSVDRRSEAQRIEGLLLAGDPDRWLDYVRSRGLEAAAAARSRAASDPEALRTLASVLRDQLALIQASIDLGPDDLALLDELERLEN